MFCLRWKEVWIVDPFPQLANASWNCIVLKLDAGKVPGGGHLQRRRACGEQDADPKWMEMLQVG